MVGKIASGLEVKMDGLTVYGHRYTRVAPVFGAVGHKELRSVIDDGVNVEVRQLGLELPPEAVINAEIGFDFAISIGIDSFQETAEIAVVRRDAVMEIEAITDDIEGRR